MGRRLNQPGRGGEEGERRPVVKGSRATAKGPGGAQEKRIKDQDRGLAKMLCTPCSSLLQCETHSRAIPSIGTFVRSCASMERSNTRDSICLWWSQITWPRSEETVPTRDMQGIARRELLTSIHPRNVETCTYARHPQHPKNFHHLLIRRAHFRFGSRDDQRVGTL